MTRPFLVLPQPLQRFLAATPLCLIAMGLALALVGCSSTPKPSPDRRSVEITGDRETSAMTVPVYIYAANGQYEKEKLEGDINSFLANLPRPSPEFKSFKLTSAPQTIDRNDPAWAIWLKQKNADYLVVVADLPLNYVDQPNNRRKTIPLDKKLWRKLSSREPLHVFIDKHGVNLLDIPSY